MTIQTTSRPQPSLWSGGTGIALGVLILLVLIGVVTLLRKKKLSPPAVTLPIALFVAALALLLPSSVSASTYLMPVGSDVYATINLNGGSTATPPVYSNAPGTQIEVVGQLELSPFSSNTYTISLSAVTVGNTTIQLFNDPVILSPSNPLAIAFPKYLTAPQCDVANPCPRLEEITVTASVVDAGGGAIGNVFSVGPYSHGATFLRKVVYVGQQIHPELTVRVKDYGRLVDPYVHTTNPIPPDNQDQIYIIPASTWSTPMPQIVSCSSNCGMEVWGTNYAVAHSVTGANVSTVIPLPYHVCRYSDAPGPGQYFSPATSSNLLATCQDNYPDAEVIR